jgi:hemoglobin/transferrin/lactoferrin receptor protein
MEANLNQSLGTIFSDSIMPLDHIPPLYGRLAIHYSNKRWQASLQSQFSDAKHRSKYYLNGEDNIQYATANGLPAWYIISTNVGYSFFKNQALHLRTGIENILDRNYRTFASGISAPGRNFYLSLAYQLN